MKLLSMRLEQKKEEESKRSKRKQLLQEQHSRELQKIWLRETSDDRCFDYESLSWQDSYSSYGLLASSDLDEGGEIRQPTIPLLSPLVPNRVGEILRRLNRLGVLQFGKKTSVDAFAAQPEEICPTFYVNSVSWRFARSATELSIKSQLLSNLANKANERSALVF
ncbi:MAG TPA: hypothetical protein VIJ79_03135 [Acidobacteriaceae bacterium]